MRLGIVDDGGRQARLAIGTERVALGIDQRAIVLDQAFERFPGQVKPVESGIAALEPGDDAQSVWAL